MGKSKITRKNKVRVGEQISIDYRFMSRLPQNGREVCAVVTTYRPDDGFPVRIERVRSQVGMVVVVDDGAVPENVKRLQAWFGNYKDVIIQHNTKNVGLAAAINIGVSLARQNGYHWLLTLDDDTLIQPAMVERLLANVGRIADGKPIGLAGMSWSESVAAKPPLNTVHGSSWVEKRGIITSGSLFSVFTYDAVGPFREDYIIGGIDYEYCMRARAKGFRIIKFMEIGFEQRLGKLRIRHLGPLAIKTYNYGAARYYYGFRNYLMNIRAYAVRDPLYAVAVLIYFVKTFLIVGLFEPDRGKKVHFMLLGLWHGIIHKMGKTIAHE